MVSYNSLIGPRFAGCSASCPPWAAIAIIDPSWHRRARRHRQVARAILAVHRARRTLQDHHGGGAPKEDMAGGTIRRPWVACEKCRSKSWVYLDRKIDSCYRCGDPFPSEEWPALPSGGTKHIVSTRPAKEKRDSPHADPVVDCLQLLLKSDRCQQRKEALQGILQSAMPTPKPKRPAAVLAEASQRVAAAVKARDAVKSKLDKVPIEINKLLEWMQSLHASIPTLSEELDKAELHLTETREESERAMLGLEAGYPVLAGTLDDQSQKLVSDVQGKIKDLQTQLVDICRKCSEASARPEPVPGEAGADMGEPGVEQAAHRPPDVDVCSEDPLLQATRDYGPSQALRSAEELAKQVGALPSRQRPGPYSGAKASRPESRG